MRKFVLNVISLLFIVGLTACKKSYDYPFQNPDLNIKERVNDLVGRLTLEEKIGQMMNNAPAIKRLGIPAYNWWNEGLHGVARSPYRVTMFPQAIGMAASFDVNAVRQMAEYTSDEGRAIFHDATRKNTPGIFRGLTYWSPNINIFRDPRWGRGQETYGEDPFLTGQIGMAYVRGIQGDNPRYLKASACAKHFAVHSGPEWNRHTFNANISNQDLWDTYLQAFRDLVIEAKVTGVMCAYNSLFGQPCCGNDLLLMDILRNQWKFDGYVTSDCGAVEDIFKTHKSQPDAASAATDAVLHGTDCECSDNGAYQALGKAVERGLITEEQIDQSVKKLFEIRFRLGMFDPDEYVPYSNIKLDVLENPAHQAQALKLAHESIVLLKNQNKLLPLDFNKLKKIAVVGPNADEESVLLANYYGYPSKVTTVLNAIRQKAAGKAEVIYEKGANLTDNYIFTSTYDDSYFSYKGEQGFWAEYYQSMKAEGHLALSRRETRLNYQWGDGEEIAPGIIARQMAAHYTTTFTAKENDEVCFYLHADDKAQLYINGERQKKLPSVQSYYLLNAKAGRQYTLKIYYVQNADNGELKLDVGKLHKSDYKQVAQRVSDADIIVFVGGLSSHLEGEQMPLKIDGFEGGDRTSLDLPAAQKDLLKQLQATGKPVVFVLLTGSAIGLEWEAANLPAILCAWYGGQAGGQAIADVLTGDYNPAGRLPVTFYKNVSQLPDFEDYAMKGRTYRYFKDVPQYAFGYGLSYTTFQYANLKITELNSTTLKVAATVTNIGDCEGDEVVQLYLSNQGRSFVTPIRSLKGFQRISLKKGEAKTVEFVLDSKELSVVDLNGHSVPMRGKILIAMGGCQPDVKSLASQRCLQTKITRPNK
ncbi:glycoside hydrolase family 3 C-terminal domain-containing protein [uncultured Bacteroides sp.]|uniref:glycoside hydrolase family 3 C-terminal domain-containing protein n=1 Tax=uncultured Bacteroides sp. TaxID=162156 RepID=UPI002AA86F53|nr:glycoside hydrolase family 3 C-terminal domain-containing protein [uncultured Bacteroides sp.]